MEQNGSNPQVPQVSDEFRMSINGRPMTSRTSAAWQIANRTLRRGLRTGVMAHLQQPGPVGRSSRERTQKKTETLSGPINLSPPARQAPRNWRLTAPKIKSSTQPTVRSRPIRNALRALQKRHAGPFPPVRSTAAAAQRNQRYIPGERFALPCIGYQLQLSRRNVKIVAQQQQQQQQQQQCGPQHRFCVTV
uniref:Uncharacterized protein n=1 Tax=Anopheles coluzzii TaxID=1518534 RepID=A0A8W7P5V9_ANOCL